MGWRMDDVYRVVVLTAAVSGCSAWNHGNDQESHAASEEETHEHGARERETSGREGHRHGDEGARDLDRSVAELFAASCEHGVKAFACDECRYEVGVVKAPESLFDGGLLKRAQVEPRAVPTPLRLTGEIRFDDRLVAHVSTQAEGIIRKVHVTLGDEVTKGQPLLSLESVAVGEAQAALLAAEAEVTLARRNSERIAALRAEGISSEKEAIGAVQALESASIRRDAAAGTLKRLGNRGSSPKGSTGKLVLRSPRGGTILDMHAVSGEVARADAPLVTVGDNASLWVWADLYEDQYAEVAKAQRRRPLEAAVSVKAFPGRTFPGTVDFLSPAMSESSRTVKLRIAVPNPGGELLAGMFADVDLFIPGDDRALSVPKGAVMEDEGRQFVFVHHDGPYYVRREVVTGRGFGEWTEIASGLTGQETVVADGAFLMKSDVLRSKMGAGCAD